MTQKKAKIFNNLLRAVWIFLFSSETILIIYHILKNAKKDSFLFSFFVDIVVLIYLGINLIKSIEDPAFKPTEK